MDAPARAPEPRHGVSDINKDGRRGDSEGASSWAIKIQNDLVSSDERYQSQE
jgi:hypothetical protein